LRWIRTSIHSSLPGVVGRGASMPASVLRLKLYSTPIPAELYVYNAYAYAVIIIITSSAAVALSVATTTV